MITLLASLPALQWVLQQPSLSSLAAAVQCCHVTGCRAACTGKAASCSPAASHGHVCGARPACTRMTVFVNRFGMRDTVRDVLACSKRAPKSCLTLSSAQVKFSYCCLLFFFVSVRFLQKGICMRASVSKRISFFCYQFWGLELMVVRWVAEWVVAALGAEVLGSDRLALSTAEILCVGGMLLGIEKIQCGRSCTEINMNVEEDPKDQSSILISSGLICWAYL